MESVLLDNEKFHGWLQISQLRADDHQFSTSLSRTWSKNVVKNTLSSLSFGFFPLKHGRYNDEHGERFHQEIKERENRYQGKVTEHMMADYRWFLRNERDTEHKRKSKRQKFV